MKSLSLFLLMLVFPVAIQANDPLDSLYAILSNQAPDTVRVDALNKLASLERAKGQLDVSDSLASLALGISKKLNSARWEAESRINLSNNAMKRGEFVDVLRSKDELGALITKAKDERIWGNYLTLIANCFNKTGNLPAALQHFQEAIKYFEHIDDKKGIASCFNNMAIVHAGQNRLDEALRYFRLATELYIELGNSLNIASGYRSQGICYIQKGELNLAKPMLDSAMIRFREAENQDGEASVLSNLGVLAYQLGELENASSYFEQEMKLISERGKPIPIAGCYINLGQVRLDQGRLKEADELINKGLHISLSKGHKEYIRNGYEKLAQVDSARGDLKSALAHFKLYSIYKDSILNESSSAQLTEIETRFETERKEQEILVLNKDNEIKQQEIKRQKLIRNGFIVGFLIMILFATIFFFQRNRIRKERDRSEELLLNILPYETAQELKEKGSADAQLIDEATVLFTDFKGFTALSEKLSPQQLVAEINECFSEFDRICARHKIEKIKTIGDAYMAAGGLPTSNGTHAVDVVSAAIEIRDFMIARKAKGKSEFEIRIGIHTGSVVAGIVGIKKFQYDIWGDTVNTASRMESSGEVGQVNISESTYKLVSEIFDCQYRGEVEAKGKGKLKMFFVNTKDN